MLHRLTADSATEAVLSDEAEEMDDKQSSSSSSSSVTLNWEERLKVAAVAPKSSVGSLVDRTFSCDDINSTKLNWEERLKVVAVGTESCFVGDGLSAEGTKRLGSSKTYSRVRLPTES